MRIDNEIRLGYLSPKDRKNLEVILKGDTQIKAQILDVKLNEITIKLPNGKEFTAPSNIPLENFIGEEMFFTILDSGNELVLRPKIVGGLQERENYIKIEKLLNSFSIPVTKENVKLIRDMLSQNLSINKETIQNVKENIRAFHFLEKSDVVFKENNFLENFNFEKLPIKNLVKNIFSNNNSFGFSEIKDLINSSNLKQKDIVFLIKNNLDINYENLRNLEELSNQDKKLNQIIENFTKEVFLKNEISKDNPSLEEKINDNIFDEFENFDIINKKIEKNENENLSKDKNLIENEYKNINIDLKTNQKVQILVKQLNSLGINIDEGIFDLKTFESQILELKENINEIVNTKNYPMIEELSSKLNFLTQMGNEYMYLQVPFQFKEYKNLLEILWESNKKSGNKRKSRNAISVFISLETQKFNKIQSILEYKIRERELNLKFLFKEQKNLMDFKKNLPILENLIIKTGINIENISLILRDIKKDDINLLKEIIRADKYKGNFDIWV